MSSFLAFLIMSTMLWLPLFSLIFTVVDLASLLRKKNDFADSPFN